MPDAADPLLASLLAAVDALPDDVALRVHVAELLASRGDREGAVRHAAAALQRDPSHAAALALLTGRPAEDRPGARDAGSTPAPTAAARRTPERDAGDVDWAAMEEEVRDLVPPAFVDSDPDDERGPDDGRGPEPAREAQATTAYDVERPELRLADVAGMDDVLQRLEASFLAPLRNPRLRELYGLSLRGGLLLYGPPGCGKTYLARALAGELGAAFLSVTVADVLDMYVGSSERNVREIFAVARRRAPCVVFLDEVDALGQKRSQLRSSAMRTAVNQLLLEMDDVAAGNAGVFVLAATNHPWDVDSALRRPGRLDRTLLVLPPDAAAREAVLRHHLTGRPVAGVDLRRLAARTDGFSGADLAHVASSAVERALLDSVASGQVRTVGQADLEAALEEVRPSTGAWFSTARNVALFANEGGVYDDLLAHLRRRKML